MGITDTQHIRVNPLECCSVNESQLSCSNILKIFISKQRVTLVNFECISERIVECLSLSPGVPKVRFCKK